MSEGEREFSERVNAVVRRYAAQNGTSLSDQEIAPLIARLWRLIATRRRVLRAPAAVKLGDAELAAFSADVIGDVATAVLAEAGRQLVKTCLYPEIPACRDSYRAVGADGDCRRQDLARTRGRISGVHCVDCPHWRALKPADHAFKLAREWRGDPAVFTRHADVFLPEDYRRLRQWLHVWACRPD